MNKEELELSYKKIAEYHKEFLEKHGVKLPALFNTKGKYIKDALVLIKLFEGYPNTRILSKEELTIFVRKFYPEVVDVQQARHLSMQKGWYIESGTRGDSLIPKGSYKLITLEKPYQAFCKERREGFKGNFESIKKEYDYRCATCGSKEGEDHLSHKGVKVKLQKGHMNPSKPLVEGNIIPQCQICNRPDRNKWIFDKTGRVIAVADSQDGVRIVKEFLKNATDVIRIDVFNFLNEFNNKNR